MSPLSAILWRAASSPTSRAPAGNVTGLSVAVLSNPSNPHTHPCCARPRQQPEPLGCSFKS